MTLLNRISTLNVILNHLVKVQLKAQTRLYNRKMSKYQQLHSTIPSGSDHTESFIQLFSFRDNCISDAAADEPGPVTQLLFG